METERKAGGPVKSRPLVTFIVVTFGFSWTLWGLWYLAFPLGLLILIVGGPLGEEVGWRGCLLPRLQARFGPLLASGGVAVVWLLWHLPLFWLEGAAQQGGSILLFGLSVLAFSLLFTWVYNRTDGSLLMAILLHTGINTASFLVSAVAPALDADLLYQRLTPVLLGAIALAVVVATRGRLGQAWAVSA
jgi:membrane protease YdiL (CAAX protease family)